MSLLTFSRWNKNRGNCNGLRGGMNLHLLEASCEQNANAAENQDLFSARSQRNGAIRIDHFKGGTAEGPRQFVIYCFIPTQLNTFHYEKHVLLTIFIALDSPGFTANLIIFTPFAFLKNRTVTEI